MSEPVFSCLCVTEERPEFMPWLLWNFDRQGFSRKELVIVDSSHQPYRSAREDVRVVVAPPGTSVPAKRNLALGAARGSFVAWFDDDDWQHPKRLELLARALDDDKPMVGGTRSWFVDMFSDRGQPYFGHRSIVFNSAGFQADLAKAVRFDERIRKASDTVWMRDFQGRHRTRGEILQGEMLSIWLCHDANISNPRARRRLSTSLDELRALLGDAWGDTDARLADLRQKLPEALEIAAPWQRARGALGEMNGPSRHVYRLLGRARRLRDTGALEENAEANVVHLTRSEAELPTRVRPGGATPRRERTNPPARPVKRPSELPAKSSRLRRAGPALPDVSLILRIAAKDAENAERLLAHVERQARYPFVEQLVVGPGALEELAAIHGAKSEYVLVVGAGVLFHTSGKSWVSEALAKMKADSRLWMMKTQGGPPAGPMGSPRSLPLEEAGRFTWDPRLSLWRSPHALRDYYLFDRQKLAALPTSPPDPTESLGEWLERVMRKNGGQSGSLGSKGTWAIHAMGTQVLHAWSGTLPRLVEQGVFPPSQRGRFSANLEDAAQYFAWMRLLEAPALGA